MTTNETLDKMTIPVANAAPKATWLDDAKSRLGVIGELFGFLWKVRLWWLIPMIVLLLVFFVVFVILPASPLAPFIYTLH
ncbi:MAG TPA: DUF5989 family protein [Aggregatilineales bacterium]|nr:hypothetical protein [Anaerolineales bacterium]HRE48705.1 DUF5989 family protein [Aggregatilineales bacterium]